MLFRVSQQLEKMTFSQINSPLDLQTLVIRVVDRDWIWSSYVCIPFIHTYIHDLLFIIIIMVSLKFVTKYKCDEKRKFNVT